jgi:hypothetical protein
VEQNVQMTVKYVSNMSNVTWSMDVVWVMRKMSRRYGTGFHLIPASSR